MTENHPATQVHDALEPRPDEPVVVKRRVSAFSGSDLDVLLRAAGADTLVLAGIATSSVVLSTLRQAADLDYRLIAGVRRLRRSRPRGAPRPDREGLPPPGPGHGHR
jgi:isochorismate hydrolase